MVVVNAFNVSTLVPTYLKPLSLLFFFKGAVPNTVTPLTHTPSISHV